MMRGAKQFCYLYLCVLTIALVISPNVDADVIYAGDRIVEGRVLEDSASVLVVETVAGEYVVVNKTSADRIEKEATEEFYYRRAKFHESKGEEEKALVDYLEVLQRNPQHEKAQGNVETIRYERKKQQWDKEIKQAENHLESQDFRQALSSYQKVLDMEPEERIARQVVQKMSDTHARLAYLFYDHCYDRGAIIELARAEELNPENAEIYYVLARLHETDRKFDIARLEYERALELDPNHQSARVNLQRVIERMRGRTFF